MGFSACAHGSDAAEYDSCWGSMTILFCQVVEERRHRGGSCLAVTTEFRSSTPPHPLATAVRRTDPQSVYLMMCGSWKAVLSALLCSGPMTPSATLSHIGRCTCCAWRQSIPIFAPPLGHRSSSLLANLSDSPMRGSSKVGQPPSPIHYYPKFFNNMTRSFRAAISLSRHDAVCLNGTLEKSDEKRISLG